LGGLLKKLGDLDITCANNGALGLEEFKANKYDLVFMDCQMPVMDGFAATRAIREYEGYLKHTPIIAITANAMTSAKEECMNAGMDEYITKPIEENRLKEIFHRFTEKLPPKTQPPIHETATVNPQELPPDDDILFDDTNLRALEDPYLVEQVIDAYVGAIIVEMDKLKVALFSDNLDETCFILHSIQGLTGNIGATGVYNESKALSRLVKEFGCTEGQQPLEALYETVETYNTYIKTLLTSLTQK
ncbi:MAG: response regulator, partial [Lentisphaeraceae bacterium]|nr:response regulator [Lentisphaeraceae bacterium]